MTEPDPRSAGPGGTASAAWLVQVVDDMHIVPLSMALIHLTGDPSILGEIEPHVRGPWDYSEVVPPAVKASLRSRMVAALTAHFSGAPLADLSADLMQRMLTVAAGEAVGEEYGPMIRAQMGLIPGPATVPESARESPDFHVVIVGAGVSGICAAIQLRQAGISCEIIEKNTDVGGTWFENRYPGCAVDTPNHFYQFSFEPNDEWPNYYSRQAANLAYLQKCADKYGLRPLIRFESEVLRAHYDPGAKQWDIVYRRGSSERSIRANALVCAVGQLNRPVTPPLPGLESFAGTVAHTAQWPANLDLKGKNVALIGAGASAVQVGCAIAPDVASLAIFQRSGSWIVRSPNIHRVVTDEMKWALKNVPFYAAWYRFQLFWGFADGLYPALRIDASWDGDRRSINSKNDRIRQAMVRYITRELEGREDLLAKVIPDYPPYGKRVLADPGWFKMLRRPNVRLITGPIEAIEPNGVRAGNGEFAPADVIVMATGFMAGRMLWPMDIVGRGGKSVREVWGDDDPRAFLGITAPDFPNLFVLYGPNTGLGHGGSFTFLAECQVRYMVGCISSLIARGGGAMAVKRSVFDAYNENIDRELKQFVWSHGSVRSWYKNSRGRIIINSPWRLVDYWNLTLRPNSDDYDFEVSGTPTPSVKTE